MQEFIDYTLLTLGEWSLQAGQLALLLLMFFAAVLGYRMLTHAAFFSRWMESSNLEKPAQNNLKKKLLLFLLILTILLSVLILQIDGLVLQEYRYGIAFILEILLIIQGARIFDWVLSNFFIHKYYSRRDQYDRRKRSQEKGEGSATRIVQYIVYLLAILLLMQNMGWDYTFASTQIEDESGEIVKTINFNISKILISVLILMVARLVVWLVTQLFLYGIYRRRGVDKGSQFAINQLIAYFIYIVAVFIALENIGINMTLIWTGAAALLVGVGLGLQQTFNDFVSGIVLLFERSTSVGDVLEFDGKVGRVQKIGMRASIMETRHNISMVVPNSKLVNENVINWSHYNNKVRCSLYVH